MKNLLLLPLLFLCSIASATLPPIMGTTGICGGGTTTLTNATTGGTWTSSNTAIATVGASSGIVTSVSMGTATISYTVGPDVVTTIVSVLSGPVATLSGCNNIGVGDTIFYDYGYSCFSPTSYGLLTSDYSVASPLSFVAVRGVSPGSVTVSMYSTLTGCIVATRSITVTPTRLISKITGNADICPGTTTTLSNATSGGIWTSSDPSAATVSSSGIVNGIASGYTAITYSLPSTTLACIKPALIYPQPTPFVGPTSVCTGDSVTITSSYCGYCTDICYGGLFSSADTTIAKYKVGKFVGVNPGTVTITYTGNQWPYCWRSATLTVNPTSVAPIVGTATVCVGATTTLSTSTTGGSWTSSATGTATVNSAGVVTGISTGTATMTYTIVNTCGTYSGTAVVTVNTLPAAGTITGTSTVCATATTPFTASVAGGVWNSSNTSVATVNTSGNVTGIGGGAATISYSVTNSCGTTVATRSVTVNPIPVAGTLSGAATVCVGAATTFASSVSGGVWSSSGTGATVSTSGVVTGVTPGTATISYAVTNGCGTAFATRVITVNPLPVAGTITGPDSVCVGATVTLTPSVSGGSWSIPASAATLVASGIVMGTTTGTAVVSYIVTNGCGTAVATKLIIVKPLPVAGAISGATTICPGTTATLTSSATGGVWSSSGTAATVSTSGVVTGATPGTTIISYAVTNSCGTDISTQVITVNSLPTAGAIAGSDSVCTGDTVILTSSVAGGTWSSSNVSVATVNTAGTVTGVATGTAIITYAVTNGCGTASTTYAIRVDTTYIPVVTMTASPGYYIASGSFDTFTVSVSSAGPFPRYQWLKNTVFIAGATNSTYITNTLVNGDSICCWVDGSGWCGKRVASCSIIQVSTVGVATISSTVAMTLFPNPNEGVFTIKGTVSDNNPVTIEVRNMVGQLVISEKFTPVNGTLNGQLLMDSELPNGPYVLSVISKGGNSLFHSGFIIRR